MSDHRLSNSMTSIDCNSILSDEQSVKYMTIVYPESQDISWRKRTAKIYMQLRSQMPPSRLLRSWSSKRKSAWEKSRSSSLVSPFSFRVLVSRVLLQSLSILRRDFRWETTDRVLSWIVDCQSTNYSRCYQSCLPFLVRNIEETRGEVTRQEEDNCLSCFGVNFVCSFRDSFPFKTSWMTPSPYMAHLKYLPFDWIHLQSHFSSNLRRRTLVLNDVACSITSHSQTIMSTLHLSIYSGS